MHLDQFRKMGKLRHPALRTARVVELHPFGEAWGNDRLLEVLDGLGANPQDNERTAVAMVTPRAFSVGRACQRPGAIADFNVKLIDA